VFVQLHQQDDRLREMRVWTIAGRDQQLAHAQILDSHGLGRHNQRQAHHRRDDLQREGELEPHDTDFPLFAQLAPGDGSQAASRRLNYATITKQS
jgi:hypothetical protein